MIKLAIWTSSTSPSGIAGSARRDATSFADHLPTPLLAGILDRSNGRISIHRIESAASWRGPSAQDCGRAGTAAGALRRHAFPSRPHAGRRGP